MKFYYAKVPHSSLPVHIVLEELGLKYEPILVDLTQDPTSELLRINPVGGVPVLELENGQTLTEIAAILQCLADQNTDLKLVPTAGTMERYHLCEWLHFIGTEFHKGFWPFGFLESLTNHPAACEDLERLIITNLESKINVIAKKLGNQQFVLSSGYSVADPYLYTILTWTKGIGPDLSRWPSIQSYMSRIGNRPATVRALSLASSQN